MTETKIIASVANPVSLGYMNDICSHKGALEDVEECGRRGPCSVG